MHRSSSTVAEKKGDLGRSQYNYAKSANIRNCLTRQPDCVSWLSQGMPGFPHEKNSKWNIAAFTSIDKHTHAHTHACTHTICTYSQILCVPWRWCLLNLSSHLGDCCCRVSISTPASPPATSPHPHWTQILGTGDVTCQNLPTAPPPLRTDSLCQVWKLDRLHQSFFPLFQIDMKKMPLGKLSKKQIQSAYKVLTELQGVRDKNWALSFTSA